MMQHHVPTKAEIAKLHPSWYSFAPMLKGSPNARTQAYTRMHNSFRTWKSINQGHLTRDAAWVSYCEVVQRPRGTKRKTRPSDSDEDDHNGEYEQELLTIVSELAPMIHKIAEKRGYLKAKPASPFTRGAAEFINACAEEQVADECADDDGAGDDDVDEDAADDGEDRGRC